MITHIFNIKDKWREVCKELTKQGALEVKAEIDRSRPFFVRDIIVSIKGFPNMTHQESLEKYESIFYDVMLKDINDDLDELERELGLKS